MTDKELLKLAAKASGIDISHWDKAEKSMVVFAIDGDENPSQNYWNPLTDDGDAFRLAVRLDLLISRDYLTEERTVRKVDSGSLDVIVFISELYTAGGEVESTRRAIVRAAAEIGKD